MSTNTDASANANPAAAAAAEAPAALPSVGALAKSWTNVRKAKAATSADDADVQTETQPISESPAVGLQAAQRTLGEAAPDSVALAALDPSWFVEPAAASTATDAPKPSWFAAPAPQPASASEPSASNAPSATPTQYQTPTAARGPTLSGLGSSAMYVGLGGAGLSLLGAAAGGGGTSSTSKEPTSTIKVVDGPIKGANLYTDNNDNGIYDVGDTLIGTTDARGVVSVASAGLGKHGLLAVGGTNDNGLPNTSTLSVALTKNPGPLVVVSPLTSLVSALARLQSGLSSPTDADIQAADAGIKTALGITGSVSLSGLDPTDTSNFQLLKAGAVVASLATVPIAEGVSVNDTVAAYIQNALNHDTFSADATLLDLLKTSQGMQSVLASSLSGISRANALATIDILAPYNQLRLAATTSENLTAAPLPRPDILGLERRTGRSATYIPDLNIVSLGGTNTEISIDAGRTWHDPSVFQWPDGNLTVYARSTYLAANGTLLVSGRSDPFSFILHATVPQTPTIVLQENTGVLTTQIQTKNGALTLPVSVGGSVLQYSYNELDWFNWTTDNKPATNDEGTYDIYARRYVQDSDLESHHAHLRFTVDRTIHAGSVRLDGSILNDTGAFQADGLTNNAKPVIVGQTDPGNTVELTLPVADGHPNVEKHSVVADANGNWSFNPDDCGYAFSDGNISIPLRISDAAGNVVNPLISLSFKIDTKLYVGTAHIEGALPDLNGGAVKTHNHTPTLSGTSSELGASVDVSLAMPDGHTLVFATTYVQEDGHWSVPLQNTPSSGSSELVPYGVDFTYSPAVTITDLAGNSNKDPFHPADFILLPGPDASGHLVSTFDTGTSNTDSLTKLNEVTLEGTATSGSSISLLIERIVVATNIAQDANGAWSWSGTISTEGLNNVSLQLHKGGDGPYSGDSAIDIARVTIDTNPPTAVTLGAAAIDHGDKVGTSSDGTLYFNNSEATPDATVLTFSGTADAMDYGATLVLQLVTSDGTPVGMSLGTVSVPADGENAGKWFYAWNGLIQTSVDGVPVTAPADEGRYFVRATVTDLAGNVGQDVAVAVQEETTEQSFVIDNHAPDLSALLHSDSLVSPTGDANHPSYTNSTAPTLGGNISDPSLASLAVSVDGTVYTVDNGVTLDTSTGHWELSLDSLADGAHSVDLTATDLAGNASTTVHLNDFVVDTQPEFYSIADPVNEPTVYGSVLGTPIQMTVNTQIPQTALFKNLVGTVDLSNSDPLPDGLNLDASGKLTGKASSVGTTWIAVHSLDAAGNDSVTNVQLAVTGSKAGKGYLIKYTDVVGPQTFSGTAKGDTYNIDVSSGDVIKSANGNDVINATGQVDDGTVAPALIDGGAGVDTLNCVNLESLDFSKFNDPLGGFAPSSPLGGFAPSSPLAGVVQNVEIFKFADGSNVTLSAADIFKLQSGSTDAGHGNAALIVLDTAGTGLSATLNGLVELVPGGTFAYTFSKTSTKIAVTSSASGSYALYQGHYVDNAGDHLVEVLINANYQVHTVLG